MLSRQTLTVAPVSPAADVLVGRHEFVYNTKELDDFKRRRTSINASIDCMIHDYSDVNLYPSVLEQAEHIYNIFKENRNITTILGYAETQSGKTSLIFAIIHLFCQDGAYTINPKNITVITGLSSIDWLAQTMQRLPCNDIIRVFHRNDIGKKSFRDHITDETTGQLKENQLIIMDEVHVAAKKRQTIDKVFEELGLCDKQTLYENDIKIFQLSATPDGVVFDLKDCADHAVSMRIRPGEGYKSASFLYNKGFIWQFTDLFGGKRNDIDVEHTTRECRDLLDNIKYRLGDDPAYHIIRVKTGDVAMRKTLDVYTREYEELFGYEMSYVFYTSDSEVKDINKVLRDAPEKHTFIFIKEKLRCAKSFECKIYIGTVYERKSRRISDSVIIQGLLGRMCGYAPLHPKLAIFTHKPSIDKYVKLVDSDFTDTTVKWESNTTKCSDGDCKSVGTFQDPTKEKASRDLSVDDVECKIFKTQEEVKQYYNDVLKPELGGRGPNRRKPNEHGFYTTTLNRRTGVTSLKEVVDCKRWALNGKHKFTFHPCYIDTTDVTTLRFVLSYKKLPETSVDTEDEDPRMVAAGGGGGAAAGW